MRTFEAKTHFSKFFGISASTTGEDTYILTSGKIKTIGLNQYQEVYQRIKKYYEL
jgi:hypothetical protein